MTRIFSKSCLRFQVPYVTSTLERQSTSMYILLSQMKSSSQEREKGKTQVKTESITKLNNFTFQWTKALYQNNLKHIAFFFTFFEGYKCNKLYEIILKKTVFMGAQENKLPKLQILQNEILHMTILPVFSQFLWNLTFISSGSDQKLSLAVITDK